MKKLGQYLIERGWISRGDLDRALAAQSAFGGRLGSCLLEAGAIPEEQLLEALAAQRDSPSAGPDLLRSVPLEVHRLIPSRLAVAHRAVPVGVSHGRLEIAAVEPWDLACQDEFAFAASRKVVPRIALEIRIAEALDRYYGQPCSKRFGRILDRLNRARYLWSEAKEAASSAWDGSGNQLFPEAPTLRFPLLPEIDIGPGSEAWSAAESSPPAPAASSPVSSRAPTGPPGSFQRAGRRTAPAPAGARHRHPAPARPATRSEARRSPGPPPGSGSRAGDSHGLMSAATDRDSIGRQLLAHLRKHFTRAALFAAVSDGIRGWMGSGAGLEPSRLSSYRVAFDEPSVFLNLRQGSGFHLGPLPPMPPHRDLARCWRDEPPSSCFLLPISVRGHLAAVLYGDRTGRSLAGLDLQAMRDLGAAAGAALERCIVLKKQSQAGARAV